MIGPEEEIEIAISSVFKEIEESLILIHKHREKIKAKKLEVTRLKNEIRNQKIIKEVEVSLSFGLCHFKTFKKIGHKYDLSAGTIKEIYYKNRKKNEG